MQQAAYSGQVQVPVQTVPPASAAWEDQTFKYSSILTKLGGLKASLSGFSIMCGVFDCVTWLGCSYSAPAIWGAILFYFPAAVLVFLISDASAPKQVAIAALVMCILSAVLAMVSFALYADAFRFNLSFVPFGDASKAAAAAAITSLVSLAEVVLATISAVLCVVVLKTPHQISTMSDQQPQVQPNTCISQPPNTWAPGGYVANPAPFYPANN